MTNIESEKSSAPLCDFRYLIDMMGQKKHLISEIMDTFLEQVPGELKSMNNAIATTDYAVIKSVAHTMKSSVSIMGITALVPVLQEMENLGTARSDIESIKELNQKLTLLCAQAIEEIEQEKLKYV